MLIGTLQEAGVHLGNVYSDSIQYNRKGLLEPKAVLFMQEDLFKANGGSWSDPPAQVEWKNLHLAVRDLFIDSMAGQPVWGFKDPRTLFTLDGWMDVLPTLELVGIFRHPMEVAASMQGRNGFPLEQGLDIWKRYNERLLRAHRKAPFPVIEFLGAPEEMRAKLATLLEGLRLPRVIQPSELSFFEEGIRQHESADAALPADVQDLYRRLQDIAL
ncbi:MAG: hypothetical protein ABIR26_11000 [Ramlibacter sp.]